MDGTEIIATVRSPSRADERYRVVIPYEDQELLNRLRQMEVPVSGARSGMSPLAVILNVLPWILLLLFIWMMFRQAQGAGNKAFSFGKSKAKRYLETGKQVSFADVAGQKEAKYELAEVVEFLKNPQKFTRMGAKIPKGVLLVGMPGTGKTLLAKAIAGEADVPFHMSGSDFVEMFVAWARAASATSSNKDVRTLHASSSLTSSTRWAAQGAQATEAGMTSVSRPSIRCSLKWTASRPRTASSS